MRIRNININEQVLLKTHKRKQIKKLYIYSLLVCATAGYGYIDYQECIKTLSEFANVSHRTARRWINLLARTPLVLIKKGNVHPIGRRKFESTFKDLTQTYINFDEDHLSSYSNFKRHSIRQYALLVQKRFRYAYKHLSSEDPTSLVKSGKVEATWATLRSRDQAGCSISQLQRRLDLDKKTISEALKGCVKKQTNFTMWIKGYIARTKYGTFLDQCRGRQLPRYQDQNNIHKFCFEYCSETDRYRLGCGMASLILVESSIKRKKYRNRN